MTGADRGEVELYRLRDPRDGRVRYVGQTTSALSTRLAGHCDTRRDRSDRGLWICELFALGMRPTIESAGLAEAGTADEYAEMQRQVDAGESLLNVRGPWWRMPASSRATISAKNRKAWSEKLVPADGWAEEPGLLPVKRARRAKRAA